MAIYEYKVVPAPSKGRKAKGVKRPEARFAYALQNLMNELAAENWEYLRADILPSEERQGLTSSQTVYRSVLVFRRAIEHPEPAVEDMEPAAPAPGDHDDSTEECDYDPKVYGDTLSPGEMNDANAEDEGEEVPEKQS